MHSRKILRIVSAVLIFITPSYLFGQKTKDKMGLTVKQQVDVLFTNLKKNLKKNSATPKQFSQINKFRSDMTSIRKKNTRQKENEEIEMDLLISGLDHLPTVTDFKKKDCSDYRNKLLRAMSPGSEDGEKLDPSTKASLEVLDILCK
jgi:hypothetical protein